MRITALVVCSLTASLASSAAWATPRLDVGLLSPPSRAPAAGVAAAYLQRSGVARAHELERAAVTPVGDGVVVRYRQLHHGVPVIGGSVVVRIDARGQVRRVGSSLFDV